MEPTERLFFNVWPEAAQRIDPSMGRSAAYAFFHRSGLIVKIGRKLLVPVKALERLSEGASEPR